MNLLCEEGHNASVGGIVKINVIRNVMEANERAAEDVRHLTTETGVKLVNVMGSPGSGKTTLITGLIRELRKQKRSCGVIEGDIETTKDAELMAGLDIPVVQINTSMFGGQCHLEASWILTALNQLPMEHLNVVFVENVGNLVCPAEFDIGADLSMAVLSVPEGVDKPAKYPLMFRTVEVVALTKSDVEAVFDYSRDDLNRGLRSVNGNAELKFVSAKTGDGMTELTRYISGSLGLDANA